MICLTRALCFCLELTRVLPGNWHNKKLCPAQTKMYRGNPQLSTKFGAKRPEVNRCRQRLKTVLADP